MSSLTDLTIADARRGLASGDFSAAELVDAHLDAIQRAERLNAFLVLTADTAQSQAKLSDKRLKQGDAGLLEGIPLGIKDLFCTKGITTTAASRMLESFVPPYESTVTSNLWREGAILVGKTNLDEFAMGSSNETSYFGPALNPWRPAGEDKPLVPGGSSGGSAVAVAARLCSGALGTDTGGSIRQPAAFNGVVGLKPTYGRCSRWGIVAFASSLDQAGPITRTVEDAAILMRVMASYDRNDSTSVDKPVPNYEQSLGLGLKGLTIGIPREYRLNSAPAEMEALWEKGINWVREAGAQIKEITLPHTSYALPAYYIVAPAEASSNLSRYDGVRYGLRRSSENLDEMYKETRAAGFGAEVKRRILMGTYVLSSGYYEAYYMKAQKIRTLILQDFENAYAEVDAILTPTTPTAAFGLQEKMNDPVSMYLNDLLTVPANMAGLPGISIPAGLSKEGLPLGLQVLGRPFDEQTLFQVASALEESADFRSQPETWWEA